MDPRLPSLPEQLPGALSPPRPAPTAAPTRISADSFYAPGAPASDPFGRFAGQEQGAASILVGISGVESIKRNLPVNVLDLVPLRPEATRLSELV